MRNTIGPTSLPLCQLKSFSQKLISYFTFFFSFLICLYLLFSLTYFFFSFCYILNIIVGDHCHCLSSEYLYQYDVNWEYCDSFCLSVVIELFFCSTFCVIDLFSEFASSFSLLEPFESLEGRWIGRGQPLFCLTHYLNN